MSSIQKDQLELLRSAAPYSLLANLKPGMPFPLQIAVQGKEIVTRPSAMFNYDIVDQNRSLPPSNGIAQLSSGGGGYTSFELKPGTIGGQLDHMGLLVTLINNDASTVTVVGNPAYWIDRVEVRDQSNGDTPIDNTHGEDIIHIFGLETSEQQQKSVCQFNGQTGNSISETVTIATTVSQDFYLPFYGDVFRQIKPFMPAIASTLEVRVYWRRFADWASTAGTLNLQLTAASLELDFTQYAPNLLNDKLATYKTKPAMFPLLTQTWFNRSVPAFSAGINSWPLTGQVGGVAFILIYVEFNSPANLAARTNYVDLDAWTIEIVDGSGNAMAAAIKGKNMRLLETEEKIPESTFFNESRRIYPIWFTGDPVASLNSGANLGMAWFDGTPTLRLTPPNGSYNAGYTLNAVLYYYKTVTIRDGRMTSQ